VSEDEKFSCEDLFLDFEHYLMIVVYLLICSIFSVI
jgi:hypothetical protein